MQTFVQSKPCTESQYAELCVLSNFSLLTLGLNFKCIFALFFVLASAFHVVMGKVFRLEVQFPLDISKVS